MRTGIASTPFISIPPGATDKSLSADFTFARASVLLSMRPHLHLRGKSFEYRARYPDGSEEILLWVPDYDFGWQTSYVLAEPKTMPAGTRLVVTGAWDNSSANPDNPDPSARRVVGRADLGRDDDRLLRATTRPSQDGRRALT